MSTPINILGCAEHMMHLRLPQEHGWLWNYSIGQDYVPHPMLRCGIQFVLLFSAILLANWTIQCLLKRVGGRLVR